MGIHGLVATARNHMKESFLKSYRKLFSFAESDYFTTVAMLLLAVHAGTDIASDNTPCVYSLRHLSSHAPCIKYMKYGVAFLNGK